MKRHNCRSFAGLLLGFQIKPLSLTVLLCFGRKPKIAFMLQGRNIICFSHTKSNRTNYQQSGFMHFSENKNPRNFPGLREFYFPGPIVHINYCSVAGLSYVAAPQCVFKNISHELKEFQVFPLPQLMLKLVHTRTIQRFFCHRVHKKLSIKTKNKESFVDIPCFKSHVK